MVERGIDRANQVDPCAGDKRNVRAFEYHVVVTNPIPRWLGGPTVTAKAVICLGEDSRVTSTHFLHIN